MKQTALEARFDLDEMSKGKHICISCIHSKSMNASVILNTTIDINSCGKIHEMYAVDANGNAPKIIEREDNGGGYWITKCKYYEHNENWNKENYYDYIKSDKWKAKRLECLKRDNFQCQKCGTAKNLVIHHWTYDRLGNEDLGDIVTLCKDCHKKIHENDLSGRE